LLAGIYIGLFVSDSMVELKKIVTSITTNEQENEKFMRTLAQRYQEEGIQTGRQEGRLEIAKNMLFKLNLGVDTVQKATDLSKEVIQNLLKDVKADRKK
jgi:predicted transposase/invertase (TIGR01784 family)